MAHIEPSGWREVAATGAALREIETLARFDRGLPDTYTVLHGVHWTRLDQGFSAYGDIDFILIAPSGRVLLIEQKTGLLQETPQGLLKTALGKQKNVHTEILRTVAQLRSRFAQGGDELPIDYLLYCPDYQVRDLPLAGIDPSRIVDASRRDQLLKIIMQILPAGAAASKTAEPGSTQPSPLFRQVSRFFSDSLQLIPDPSAMIGQAAQLVTRLSGGLATWARQLDFTPYRLRVVATAGSGKTQLALAEYRAAIAAGKKPLYVCYNRPLADHIGALVPPGGRVATFHILCDAFARELGTVPDYSAPDVWQSLEKLLAAAAIPEDWRFDVLIVDEGQDFTAAWQASMLRLLRDGDHGGHHGGDQVDDHVEDHGRDHGGGRAIWLEDPMQNLYDQAPLEMPGWVTLHSHANYRSPRQIVDLLGHLGEEARAITAASPFAGEAVDWLTYPAGDTEAMLEKTKQAVTLCLGAGFARSDVAIVTFRGREKSRILQRDTLGKHALHSFTGRYDLFGVPVFRSGELLAETIYRFKGQAAPAVIFTEIDFQALDERAFRKLFVGMTRARLKLVLVISDEAAAILRTRLGEQS